MSTSSASLDVTQNPAQINCSGRWALSDLTHLHKKMAALQFPSSTSIAIDVSKMTAMDTAGAWMLFQLIQTLQQKKHQVTVQGLTDQQQELLDLIDKTSKETKPTKIKKIQLTWVESVGKNTITAAQQIVGFCELVGEICVRACDWIRHPKKIQWGALFNTIENSGYRALPIIGLLSFLIGIVLAYQMGTQLRNYGANIFIVNLIGLSLLREFAPLITAIIIAGRSGSAFTAQLGTMQVNEEIDALRTMGIPPVERLVLQKFFGLIIALPLLIVWADVTGVLGGMLMANNMLDIGYVDFLSRFQSVIPLKTYIIGLCKAPIFAMIIASIGCFQGFQVRGSAESVGQETTKSVVRAIFLIICADAFFSVLLSWNNL